MALPARRGAHHHDGRPVERWAQEDQREARRQAERQKIFTTTRRSAHRATSSTQIAGEGRRGSSRRRTSSRSSPPSATTSSSKLENISLGYCPGPKESFPYFGLDWQPKIPKIQQVVLEEFDRNAYYQPVARVDRCTSCHAAIDKPGFEDQPNPWKTHPKREALPRQAPDRTSSAARRATTATAPR